MSAPTGLPIYDECATYPTSCSTVTGSTCTPTADGTDGTASPPDPSGWVNRFYFIYNPDNGKLTCAEPQEGDSPEQKEFRQTVSTMIEAFPTKDSSQLAQLIMPGTDSPGCEEVTSVEGISGAPSKASKISRASGKSLYQLMQRKLGF